jgi:hypothetical protein
VKKLGPNVGSSNDFLFIFKITSQRKKQPRPTGENSLSLVTLLPNTSIGKG